MCVRMRAGVRCVRRRMHVVAEGVRAFYVWLRIAIAIVSGWIWLHVSCVVRSHLHPQLLGVLGQDRIGAQRGAYPVSGAIQHARVLCAVIGKGRRGSVGLALFVVSW